MREIKFRAWDKHYNKMIYKFCIGSVTNIEDDLWTCPTSWDVHEYSSVEEALEDLDAGYGIIKEKE